MCVGGVARRLRRVSIRCRMIGFANSVGENFMARSWSISQGYLWVRRFKERGVPLVWREDPKLKRAFEAGETGFPIVDAAVRQLLKTGWMHNRLRMIVASFYCKLLLLPWWEGEAFFMRHLIDGDFASNNGGWQWCASTGCDASPWFRIFSPLRQSEKFDPKGAFIAAMLPGFDDLAPDERHDPALRRGACRTLHGSSTINPPARAP